MTDRRISVNILQAIDETAKGRHLIREILRELLYTEVERGRNWHWKDVYQKTIQEYATRKDNDDENR